MAEKPRRRRTRAGETSRVAEAVPDLRPLRLERAAGGRGDAPPEGQRRPGVPGAPSGRVPAEEGNPAPGGPGGGFWADDKTLSLPAYEVLKVTDGRAVLSSCLMGKKNCSSDKPCPLHHDYAACRDTLVNTLRDTKISDLVEKVELGEVFLGEGH